MPADNKGARRGAKGQGKNGGGGKAQGKGKQEPKVVAPAAAPDAKAAPLRPPAEAKPAVVAEVKPAVVAQPEAKKAEAKVEEKKPEVAAAPVAAPALPPAPKKEAPAEEVLVPETPKDAEEIPELAVCDFAPELAEASLAPAEEAKMPEPEKLQEKLQEKLELAQEEPAALDNESTCAPDSQQANSRGESPVSTTFSAGTCRVSAVCSSTQPGQVLAMVGSDPALGSWDPAKALELTTCAERFPTWSVDVAAVGEGAEFKLIIKASDGGVIWEPREQNRAWAPVDGVIAACYGQA